MTDRFYFDPDRHFIERHDDNPMRFYPVEHQQRDAAELKRLKTLVDAWRNVPWELRQRAIQAGSAAGQRPRCLPRSADQPRPCA